MTDTVKIELNAQEAQEFIAWQEHHDLFKKLLDLGVFGVRNGSAELHFDAQGALSNAKLHFTVFNRVVHTKPVVSTLTVIKKEA